MSYKLEIDKEKMHKLWILKTYCSEPPIAQQLRTAVNDYLLKQVEKLGVPIEDIEEVIERKEREEQKKGPICKDESFPPDRILADEL